ncbi:unnamed protein product [Ectocarpus sp. CCAP 1310/34]|nr:unnamed protein product [Ectocarpus sp. CCAP 1310/34]
MASFESMAADCGPTAEEHVRHMQGGARESAIDGRKETPAITKKRLQNRLYRTRFQTEALKPRARLHLPTGEDTQHTQQRAADPRPDESAAPAPATSSSSRGTARYSVGINMFESKPCSRSHLLGPPNPMPSAAPHGPVPRIPTAQTSLCLHYYVSSEAGALEEHAPPRRLENEMPPEMIQEHEALIRMLHFQNNDTKAIYKTIQRDGWRLGARGKQQVRTMRTRFEKERAASVGGANDAQQLLRQLQSEGCWMSFTLDNSGRINRIAWALDEQKKNALRYYPLIIQDNTFNTNQ